MNSAISEIFPNSLLFLCISSKSKEPLNFDRECAHSHTHQVTHTTTTRACSEARSLSMAEQVKLISSFGSTFSHRAEVALRLKQVPYELVLEDLRNKSGLLLTHNPVHKKVPVLLHGDRPAICESLVIIEYVDAAFIGPPLLPADTHDRATARFWGNFIDEKCMKSLWAALWMEPGEVQRKSMVEAKGSLILLQEHLGDRRRFFGGDSVGLVDIAASGLAHWLGVMEEISGVTVVTDEEFPALRCWATRYVDNEDVKGCLPKSDELVVMFSAFKEMFRAMAMANIEVNWSILSAFRVLVWKFL